MQSGKDLSYIIKSLEKASRSGFLALSEQLLKLVEASELGSAATDDAKQEQKQSSLEIDELIETAKRLKSGANVQACDKNLKRAILPSAHAAYCLHLADLEGSDIIRLRIYAFEAFNKNCIMQMMRADLNYYLSVSMRNGKKLRFVIKDKNELPDPLLIQKLIEKCPEEMLEVSVPKSERLLSQPLQASTWSTMYIQRGDVTEYYSEINDPIVLKAVQDYEFEPDAQPVILDLGGGRGRLAKQILARMTDRGLACRYILLEPCQSEIQIAEEKLSEMLQASVVKHKLVYVNDKACKKTLAPLQGQVSLVISSGGPLNDQIVDLETAKQIASLLFSCLKPGGRVISTGLTYNLLSAKDFKALGFTVKQMASSHIQEAETPSQENPDAQQSSTEYLQCYVLEKPESRLLLPSERDELPAGLPPEMISQGLAALQSALDQQELKPLNLRI